MTEKHNAFGQHFRGSTVFTMVLVAFVSGALPIDNAYDLTGASFFAAGGRLRDTDWARRDSWRHWPC